ncbi:hypothetical protein ERJ70_15740 [Sediminibacillus dalangtanensis]|uniref:Uncharacterized protein n=1 Tax=Sediminibacillus dalangtanensis TaxID=2729421 RepID=A0ABX7W0T9_9BACI|nr:hypothetical protein [Sediminibacillus dalangtanensis]QTN00618.1 hypothetical protein ERJ70_15740 [Sediminibacillus dalangtanensis]
MDYTIAILFGLIAFGLLFRASKREKRWLGGFGAILGIIFLIGCQIVKWQSGFFDGYNQESSEAVGNWVVLGFIILGIYLLLLINYRWIRFAWGQTPAVKWTLLFVEIVFSLFYIIAGYFLLFVLGVLYFSFAP